MHDLSISNRSNVSYKKAFGQVKQMHEHIDIIA